MKTKLSLAIVLLELFTPYCPRVLLTTFCYFCSIAKEKLLNSVTQLILDEESEFLTILYNRNSIRKSSNE